MDSSSTSGSSVISSPFPSPNYIGACLKMRILSWSHETGLPASVTVKVADKTFNLHKKPLYTKSGYFRNRLNNDDCSTEIEISDDFPGGSETFGMIALFLYGSSIVIDPFNIVSLRCAADFLEMTEDYCTSNLSARFDLYLNQVVLQSWDDTLIVLQQCQTLIPWSEELLIVSRCIESIAFMACMEILDPERRREEPVVTIKALMNRAWSSEFIKDIVNQDTWIKDLIALPIELFKRIMKSLRRQGMKEKYVSPIIVFYAKKWIISEKTRQFWENSSQENGQDDINDKVIVILQGVLDLLPFGEKASRVIPVGFYFALLYRYLETGFTNAISESKLVHQIALLLPDAQIEDFLVPESPREFSPSSKEIDTMKNIFSVYVSSYMNVVHTNSEMRNHNVSEIWDLYLSRIASDSEMGAQQLVDLIERLPISIRQSHDLLYLAISNFLQAHPKISPEEINLVCKHINCKKLSQETCIEAVQNSSMPLRLIVQALFVQQMNTQQAFKECSDSFRFTNNDQISRSFSSSHCPNNKTQNLEESPSVYESTSFRIQNLELELASLKTNLQRQKMSQKVEAKSTKKVENLKTDSTRKKDGQLDHANGCTGSIKFTSHRKYATSFVNVFRRIILFGRGK